MITNKEKKVNKIMESYKQIKLCNKIIMKILNNNNSKMNLFKK